MIDRTMSSARRSDGTAGSASGRPAANGSRPLAAQLAYWKEQLAGCSGTLELPSDRPRPATRTFRAADHSFALSQHLTEAANTLSRSENVSLFATLLAVFQTVLHRYTNAEEFIIGTPAPRSSLNPLALRTRLHGDPTFREVLARADQTARDAFALARRARSLSRRRRADSVSSAIWAPVQPARRPAPPGDDPTATGPLHPDTIQVRAAPKAAEARSAASW